MLATECLISLLLINYLTEGGMGGYSIYGSYKINQLSTMTFGEMLDCTTKDNKDAVTTVGIIQNGKMT